MKTNIYTRLLPLLIVLTIIVSIIYPYKYVQGKEEDCTKKKVYLTFDDGPIPIITDKILDTLKEQNVKATFFVVGKEIPEREELLKRMHNDGHTIGLHTYSHKFKKIYRSEDALVNEMLQTQKKIKETINISPTSVRFPGGSSHHLTRSLLDKLHSYNLKVYDWNVDLYDGSRPDATVSQIIKNGENIKPQYSRIIILAHCNSNNMNTVKALPEIIKFYKDSGFEFCAITDDTDEYYYRLKQSFNDFSESIKLFR
ncbi:polysaccharide deacetylase [Clostridium sp. YIM B02515]|uniref:Polysaccharide deacetylase n=1 Tax=Clostridium rhizosphaerae TaxID=2803861 RepID=A0ABS1T4V6_9CLOT|nr:polysaccharide deacetylase family protein [Clostridium rhizosphaerae]MBL4934359.1 polysaccharide deacetylase [Clostridium rhizosphaerae]